ncbi:MAG: RseA family anti-sigma factor [Immundisolibacteraceae bacterium]|nr:RseA family anti-sigma factor [Immundisolibacteraceae bacterium]
MKKARLEQVSSLVDDEQGGSGKSVVDDLLKDAESRDAWQRYHELGDWMRNMADGGMVRVDVADRVSAAIEGEPTLLFPVNHRQAPISRPSRRGWSQQLAGIGIAAAVATVTVLLFQQQEFLETEPDVGVVAINETTPAEKEKAVLGPASLAKVDASEEDELLSGELFQQKLDAYLASHVKQSAGYRAQGLLPNIRAVDHGGTGKGN